MTMPIERIDDWEMRLKRQDAWWDRQILDRPVCIISFGKPDPEAPPPPPQKQYASERERWFDFDHHVAQAVHNIRNTGYAGDALPLVFPNLGPEVFSAFFGHEMVYRGRTSYAIPIIEDWNDLSRVQFSRENPYWKAVEDLTGRYLEAGQGLYYTGLTDIHPGGDALAALRDPQDLNLDLLFTPEPIKALLKEVGHRYVETMDHYFAKMERHGQAKTTWAQIVSTRRWYVPSNDFSCMISKEMFEEFFLDGIRAECQYLENSIYHLDGPKALHHLDALLEIPELDAIQWVYGAGNGRATDWLDVYRRIQAAGKGLQVTLAPGELDTFMEALRPEGVWMRVAGVKDQEEADAVLKRVTKWT